MRPIARLIRLSALGALASVGVSCTETEPTPLELNGPPVSLSVLSGNGQTGPSGSPLAQALTVLVRDEAGQAVPAVEVRWTATGGTLSATIDSTDDDGQASVSWTMPANPGDYNVEASVVGLGTAQFSARATPPGGSLVFRYLDAGSYHSCGITTTEELYCWGYNGDGQAGDSLGGYKMYPTKVERAERFRAVSGGRYHTCGITLSGEVVCWGASRDGRTAGGGPATYQFLQAGELFSCGVTLRKQVWCWGWNREGEAGRGRVGEQESADSTFTPLEWTDPLPPAYRSVSAGAMHACAIVQQDGRAYCWGFGRQGQLGVGPVPFLPPWPTSPVPWPDALSDRKMFPTQVVGARFRSEPFTVVPRPPDPAFPLPPGPFIAAGFAHTCGISDSGGLLCWGLNEKGQLGNGNTNSSDLPVQVSTQVPFVQITAGNSHTCAITGAGAAYCWGDNTYGQLGDGTTSARLTPTLVSGALTFAYIKAGELSTCGLTTTGVGYCWGDNEYGQLGIGTQGVPVSTPRKVAFQP